MNRCIALLAILAMAGITLAGKPAKVPPGMGKYLIVLWDAGTPVPGSTSGEKIKKVPEPDVVKLGGRVLYTKDNRRVVLLPLGVAKQLKKNAAVVYVQRLWAGESLDTWDEGGVNSVLRVQSNADIDLTWGPRTYTYDGSGNITAVGSDTFAYDSVDRLKQASVNGKTESYVYDAFGNLTQKAVTGGGTVTVAVDSASNRISGSGYDPSGNLLTRNGRVEYSYDPLNMMVTSRNGRRMIYDANDERIGTIMDSSLSRWTMRDFDGQIIREFKSDDLGDDMIWFWSMDQVRGEKQVLAGETQEWSYIGSNVWGGDRHYHLDHLGSVRVVTDEQGRSLDEHDFYPYGVSQTKTYQEQINWGDPHVDAMRFAGHWRDFLGWLDVENTDYLDYMHARYYDPNSGRFLSIDPVLDLKKAQHQPQGWNRYSYAYNNPTTYVDPDGRVVNLASMDEADRAMLIQQLRAKTGLDLVYEDKKLVSKGVLKDENGKVLGSATARADITAAIGAKTIYYGMSMNNSAVNMGERVGPLLKLDFADIALIDPGKNDPATFDAASIFMHELGHAMGRTDPVAGMLKTMPMLQGNNVIHDNKIRKELGLELRGQYLTVKDGQGRYYIPFTNGPVYVPFEGGH